MNWKKITANVLGAFVSSFLAGFGAGIPPKEAAIAAGIATATNLAGLFQQEPRKQ